MNQFLKKYPVPIVGLILGLAASGNLVQSHGEVYHSIFGIIALILFTLIIAKIIKYPKGAAEKLNNPVVANTFPTLSMSIMLMATYLKEYAASLAFTVWIAGLIIHILLILWFTKKFVLDFNIEKVFSSWFIVYVGIVFASVTGPVFGMANVGRVIFWFGFITYLVLLPVVIYRVIKFKKIPEEALPTLAIFAAPASLLLAGYMNSFKVKNMIMFWLLITLSIIMYSVVIIMLFKLLRLKFYPSYSGFTFPLVISAMAMKLVNGFLNKSGQAILSLKYLAKFQEAAGVLITLYVLVRYIQFLIPKDNIS